MNADVGGASEGVGSVFGGFFASIFESANKGIDDEDTADVIFSSDSLVRRNHAVDLGFG